MYNISQDEYNEIVKLKSLISYDQNQVASMLNLTRKFANPNVHYCPSCNSSIADAKKDLYDWFNHHQENILKELTGNKTVLAVEQVTNVLVEVMEKVQEDKTELNNKFRFNNPDVMVEEIKPLRILQTRKKKNNVNKK